LLETRLTSRYAEAVSKKTKQIVWTKKIHLISSRDRRAATPPPPPPTTTTSTTFYKGFLLSKNM